MTGVKPTILIVHGGWHTPKHFEPLRQLLQQKGYDTVCPQLPGCASFDPSITMYEDAAVVREAANKLVVEEEKDVIAVLHSYGGFVATEALGETLGRRFREGKGLKGGVRHLLYLAAILLLPGMSTSLAFTERPLLMKFKIEEGDGALTMTREEAIDNLYHDLPPAEQDRWFQELKCYYLTTQLNALNDAAWKYIPSTYLFCEQDRSIQIERQRWMVECVEKEGVQVQKVVCDSGHSPFLTIPDRVVELVEGLAG